ncbi:hypothetical protein [Collimonas sp. OK242]|uniref:hypothetical protein n=1 Tax=Collimonas sp. OK242 TaxID=1798195 RepID=UPI00115F9EA0|nr:hypothetical protein [Collimonas sp. OK242]
MTASNSSLGWLETDMQTDCMESQLLNLIRVYRLRMDRIEILRSAGINDRNNVDKLLLLLRDDMKLVSDQRRDWQSQWQKWLQEGGTLGNGRNYNAHHMQLREIENLLRQHQAGMEARRADIQMRIATLNRDLIRHQEKIRFAEEQQADLKNQDAKIIRRHESDQNEDTGLRKWFSEQLIPAEMRF